MPGRRATVSVATGSHLRKSPDGVFDSLTSRARPERRCGSDKRPIEENRFADMTFASYLAELQASEPLQSQIYWARTAPCGEFGGRVTINRGNSRPGIVNVERTFLGSFTSVGLPGSGYGATRANPEKTPPIQRQSLSR
jgi:hypothetical protein